MVIYCIINKINNKLYIGQTRNKLSYRLTQHKAAAKKGTRTPLYHAIRKYGYENFETVVVFTVNLVENLNILEQYLISSLNTTDPNIGYNICSGGKNYTRTRSPMKGRKHTMETRKKQSLARMGMKFTEEHRSNISKGKKGIKRSPESVRAQVLTRTGQKKAGRRVICLNTGEIFPSIVSMSEKLQIPKRTLTRALSKNKSTKQRRNIKVAYYTGENK
jgi:group I intron endonuclease